MKPPIKTEECKCEELKGYIDTDYTPKIEVVKRAKEWTVQFGIGNQFFELYYGGTKAEANWMAKMLKKAFKNASYIK